MRLVSIITPTIAGRERSLARAAASVAAQTYQPVEHVVVADGPLVQPAFGVTELGRRWGPFSGGRSVGAAARLVGTHLAKGDYIGYVDDDDELLPWHVANLVELLEETKTDFVLSMFSRNFSDGRSDAVGDGTIRFGHVGTPMVLHRAECLLTANWQLDGYSEDFMLLHRWCAAGLKYSFLPKITVIVNKEV